MKKMRIFFKHNKWFIWYIPICIVATGMGMGVPVFNILLGIPVGFYLSKIVSSRSNNSFTEIVSSSLKFSTATAFITFLLMAIIWLPTIIILFDHSIDIMNFGIPMIMFNPLPSFIAWIILMVFISPALQFLLTFFVIHLILYNKMKIN
jgi:hypothetical protein